MAQLKGSILFTGSIGNLRSFYNKKLKRYILSTKGGASKEVILNNPAFARTRENNSEFKACGIWSSNVRKSLLSISHLFDGYYFSGIVKSAKEIQLHDDGHARGIRSIESSKIPVMLTRLNFNNSHPFDSVLSDWPKTSFSEDKRTITMRLSGFNSYSRLHWPTRYVSYRFALVIAQLSDLEWNEEESIYRPVIRDLEQLSVKTYTEWFLWSTEPRDIFLEASFAKPALQEQGTMVIVAMGIEVSSTLLKATDSYLSPQGTMKIVEYFL